MSAALQDVRRTWKLALAGAPVAQVLAVPIFIGANGFIGYLALRTAHLFFTRRLLPKPAA